MKHRHAGLTADLELAAALARATPSMVAELDQQMRDKIAEFDKAVGIRALTLLELRGKLEHAVFAAEQLEDLTRVLMMLRSCLDDLPEGP